MPRFPPSESLLTIHVVISFDTI